MDSICDETLHIMENAIKGFNQAEAYLLENDLSERCICSRLAFYIQKELLESLNFRDYIVDVEYNRGFNRSDSNPKCLHGKK